ncbi:uncharacterized protein LOC130178756, partial [Seriola aureovittata]|uniref:uncharacterized protein LOC130178756 n=1 Tax=Seriola aureovittata TaxID=2871759 RepID=UPI0024BE3965
MLSLDYYVLSLLFVSTLTGVSCEKLSPVKTEEFSSEGSTVTLSYNYSTKATGGDYFFWYRQYPGKPPEFLISHLGTQNETKDGTLAVDYSCCSFLVQVKIMMLLLVWIMIVSFHSGSSEDLVKPFRDEVMGSEGDTVTLSCNYSGSVNSLYWYQQKSSSSPQFLIADYSEKTPGLSLQHDKKTREFHLNISSAAVTDSAVYYCALWPTVTGNTKTL